MSLQNVEDQRKDEELDHNCSLCPNPPDDKMTTCVDCHKRFHNSCINVTEVLTYKCASCSIVRPMSPILSESCRCSNISHVSQTRKINLQLKRLEEERELNKRYLDEKYQLLEQAEVLSDSSSIKSQPVHNWLASSDPNPSLPQQAVLNNQKNTINPQSTYLPNGTLTSRNRVEFCPQTFTTAAISSSLTTSAVPNSTTAIASSGGYQPRMQPTLPNASTYSHSAILTSLPTDNSMPFNTSQNNYNQQNLFNSVPQQFIPWLPMPSSTNYTNNVPTAATRSPSYVASQQRLKQNHIDARQSLPKELPTFSGLPEEWPIFSSTYEWSTTACAFTDM